jgi:hypothetical protein
MRWLLIALLTAARGLAQEPPPTPPASPDAPSPRKAPKPKSRMKLLRQMQIDLDMAATHAKVDDKGRKLLDKCHETLIDAIAQQQRFHSVNAGKINRCLDDLEKLDDAGAFEGTERNKLREDREKLGDAVGKPRRFHLPKPL